MNYQKKIYERKTKLKEKSDTQSLWGKRSSQHSLGKDSLNQAMQKITGTESISSQESQFCYNFSQVPVKEINFPAQATPKHFTNENCYVNEDNQKSVVQLEHLPRLPGKQLNLAEQCRIMKKQSNNSNISGFPALETYKDEQVISADLGTHIIQKMDQNEQEGDKITDNMVDELGGTEQQEFFRLISDGFEPEEAYAIAISIQGEATVKSSSKPVPQLNIHLNEPPGGLVEQEESAWCYAATAMTLARYKKIAKASDPIWKVVAATQEDSGQEQEIREKYGAKFGQEDRALKALSVPYQHLLGVNLDIILQQLAQGNAVILTWGGHSRVVVGANTTLGINNFLNAWDPKDRERQDIQIALLDDQDCEIYY
jgi:hypothetical protein